MSYYKKVRTGIFNEKTGNNHNYICYTLYHKYICEECRDEDETIPLFCCFGQQLTNIVYVGSPQSSVGSEHVRRGLAQKHKKSQKRPSQSFGLLWSPSKDQ